MGMAPAPSSDALQFGPNRAPIWIGRISGLEACLSSAPVLFAGFAWNQGVGVTAACALFGLIGEAFGIWMLLAASRISRFRATLTPDRRKRSYGGAARGARFQPHRYLEPGRAGRRPGHLHSLHQTGDFNLNDVRWKNLHGLTPEISRRTGLREGHVTPERTTAQTELPASERRMRRVLRVFGWILLAMCAILFLPVIAGALAAGFSSDLSRAAFFLVFAAAAAVAIIRFYRRH
jgi:hypothetical protein